MQAECLIPPFGMNGCDFQYILLNGLVILDFGFRTYQVIATACVHNFCEIVCNGSGTGGCIGKVTIIRCNFRIDRAIIVVL